MPQKNNKRSYRNKASFGKRIEYFIISQMLKEGLDVYVPVVDDRKVDAIVRRKDGTFAEVQIKAKSKDVKHPYLFADISLPKGNKGNYYFIFYTEKNGVFITLSLEKFKKFATCNKKGKNEGKYNITLDHNFVDEMIENKILSKNEINSFTVLLQKANYS